MPEVIGIDHVYITVSDMARSEAFYDKALVGVLGFRKSDLSLGAEPHIQYYCRHFGYVIRPARHATPNDPYAPGLHHFCLRVNSIDDVAAAAVALRAAGIEASEPARHAKFALDYWATMFTDPDGIRLEVTNYRQARRDTHDHWDELAE